MRVPFSLCFASGLIFAATGPSSCQKQPAAPAVEPPVVTVAPAIEHEVTDFVDYTGRVDAVNAVDVRARVTGYLEQMPFKEGDEVEKGALLFLIDDRPYVAQLAQAEAQVQLNEAALKLARANNARAKHLSSNPGVITQQDLDQYQATEDQARAQLEASKAAVATYRLNVGFTRVTSPIEGQVSRYYYTTGNLVNQDQTLLTTLVSLDPIYVYFDVDEITVLKIKREINEGKLKPMREVGPRPVLIGLPGENGFPHRGNLTFINNRVDPNTGTLTVRGVFANPRPEHGARLLTPGMFARVRLPLGQPHQAVLVVERALGVDQGAKFLYVVNAENKVEYRRVKTGALQPDGMRVIEEGVKPGELVIVSGLQLARPNATVTPDQTTMEAILRGIGAGEVTSEQAAAGSGGGAQVAEPVSNQDAQRPANAKSGATDATAPADHEPSATTKDHPPQRPAAPRKPNPAPPGQD